MRRLRPYFVTDREERGHGIKLALLTVRQDLLVSGLDLLEADGLTRPVAEPAGERLGRSEWSGVAGMAV